MIKNNKIKFADVLLILLFVVTIIYFSINFFLGLIKKFFYVIIHSLTKIRKKYGKTLQNTRKNRHETIFIKKQRK